MSRYLALIVTVLLVSCGTDSSKYQLSGSAAGFEDGTEVYVYKLEGNSPTIKDTITISGGEFNATYPKTEDSALHYLRVGNNGSSIVFFPENEDLKATIYKDSIQASYVSGGLQNKAYNDYMKTMKWFNDKKQDLTQRFKIARAEQDNLLASEIQKENVTLINEETAYKKKFLTDNNNSVFSVMLAQEMLGRKQITGPEATTFVENLTPKIASLQLTKNLQTTIEAMKSADIGGKAPEFSAPTPTGEELSLKETLGKYTIIDFWASWCRPCRMENPNVVRVYEKYHDKGLNIISVSLDKANQKERWLKAIEDDNMDWYHVSNLQFWQDPIARKYNVRSIPATFLLDENGVIIDKDLRGPALENKMASLLGQ